MKFLLGLILGLIVASSYFISQKPSLPETTRKEFQVFTQSEAKKFAEATDEASKLRAAEELYGKMMILFLANMGLELQKSRPVITNAPETLVAVEKIPQKEIPEMRTECTPCSQSANTSPRKEEKAEVKLTTPEKFLPRKFENVTQRPLQSSVVVALGMARDPKGKISDLEEQLAMACAVQNMHLTCAAYGLGAFWGTGAPPTRAEIAAGGVGRCVNAMPGSAKDGKPGLMACRPRFSSLPIFATVRKNSRP